MINLTGQIFGRLTVLSYDGGSSYKWAVRCECGEKRSVAGGSLRNGTTKSCGCLNREMASKRFSIGGSSRRDGGVTGPTRNEKQTYRQEFFVWRTMRNRCQNPKNPVYKNYGGRGIKVADVFIHGDGQRSGLRCFIDYLGPRPSSRHSVDRIDNDGDYAPGNVRWATYEQQARNSRYCTMVDYLGIQMPITHAIKQKGILQSEYYALRQIGLPPQMALNYGYPTQAAADCVSGQLGRELSKNV